MAIVNESRENIFRSGKKVTNVDITFSGAGITSRTSKWEVVEQNISALEVSKH